MIKCDLHIHSKYSFDSLGEPRKIVDIALKKGLQCIAIADHGNIKGSFAADRYVRSKKLPILIIISEEVKSKSGDILALNIKEPISDHLPAEVVLRQIKSQGGTSIIAHPFGLWCSFKDNPQNYLGKFDGVEILNASVFRGNSTARTFAKENNLPFTAGSDAHFANRFIGKTWLELPLDYSSGLTAEQVIGAIKQRKGKVGGSMASFFDKAVDHPLRTLTKIKKLF